MEKIRLFLKRILPLTLALLMTLGLYHPLELHIEDVPQKSEGAYRMMSVNVRCGTDLYGTKSNRSILLNEILLEYAPDLIGFQEVNHFWRAVLVTKMGSKYGFVGEFRDRGYFSEASPIFYLKEKFDLLDSGTIWLSDTPEVAGSKDSASKYPRVLTWATLQDKENEKVFSFVNTHLDLTDEAINAQAERVLLKVNELSEKGTVICTGDFNACETSDAYKLLTSALDDCKYTALKSDDGITFHDYGKVDPSDEENRIDHVFATKGTSVEMFKIVRHMPGDMYPSDHYQLCCDFVI